MGTLLIKPVKIKAKGGHEITIDGINPASSDPLSGSIVSPGQPPKDGSWDLHGRMRDASDDCNFDPADDYAQDVIATAKKLGAE